MKNIITPLIAFTGFAASVALYFFFAQIIDGYSERIVRAAADAQTLTQKDSALQIAETELADVNVLSTILGTFVSTDSDVVQSITLVEKAGRSSGVSLTIGTVGVTETQDWKHHEQIALALYAEGSFLELLEFISTLESLPILSRLETVAFRKFEDGSWGANIRSVFVKQKL